MTSRLYYTDSYTTRFRSPVLETTQVDGRPAVVLQQSFFYPTSGGQPHDTGRLGSARVLDVRVREADGEVLHLLDREIPAGEVEGEVDWVRRFDHMQQHTGQHVLSQAFIRVAQARTIGFHLGDQYVSIDLEAGALSEESTREAFELAN